MDGFVAFCPHCVDHFLDKEEKLRHPSEGAIHSNGGGESRSTCSVRFALKSNLQLGSTKRGEIGGKV